MAEQAPVEMIILSRRAAWAETGFVLLVVVVPELFESFTSQIRGHHGDPGPFWVQAWYLVIRSAGAVALVIYVLSRSGRQWRIFGFRRPRFSDLAWGVILLMVAYLFQHVVWIWIRIFADPQTMTALVRRDTSVFATPSGGLDYTLLGVMSLANGLAEELVMRAYFITRLRLLLCSNTAAVAISTLLFTAYHSYQGAGALISIGVIGLTFGIAFCVFNRLAPLVVAHAILDFWAIASLAAHRG